MKKLMLVAVACLALMACDEKNRAKGQHRHGAQAPIPEPASVVLFATGLGVLAWRCRR